MTVLSEEPSSDRMSSYTHSFELKELPPSLNKFMRMHFRERHKEFNKIKSAVHLSVLGHVPYSPLTRYSINLTRHTIRPLDPFDNLPGSFKVIIDALVSFGIIKDDKWGMAENISCRQVKVKSKADQKITVSISDCDYSRMATRDELETLKVQRDG